MLSDSHSTKDLREDIAQRLEKLNKWQEEQKKLLQERQDMQRQMLGIEQRQLYEMLGIVHSSGEELQASSEKINDTRSKVDKEENISSDGELKDESLTFASNTCTEAQRKTSGYCTEDLTEMELAKISQETKPRSKHTFLRRGEGLKQRFKIDPNVLRLNNLPRYKYANAHPQFLIKQKRNTAIGKMPKKENSDQEIQMSENVLETQNIADMQEKRFQQLLISSQNTCASTPEMKSTHVSSSSSLSLLPKVRFVEISATNQAESSKELDELNPTLAIAPPVTWSKVLDSQQIKPISVQELRHQYNPEKDITQNDSDSNLSLFELLEKKANEGSIDMNSTCVREFMLRKLNVEKYSKDRDEIPVRHSLQKATILPKITIESSLGLSELNDDIPTEHENTLTPKKSDYSDKQQYQVRFCSENTEIAEESHTLACGETSSFNMFQKFKEALFSALQSKEEAYNATISSNESEIHGNQSSPLQETDQILSLDLKTKMNLVKVRLEELEKEITSFKENNINLIKAKQEHELEKAQFAQERIEAIDKLNDAKIQMEIYFHDERMKIEDEKRKFEHNMQLAKSATNSKDRKEIAHLKQELEEMQSQLKLKEQSHVAAQARLRAQIRNIEKDQKQLYLDIERLTKENKRLQNENMKISRENNNKMLQEINRNIAKLAPKVGLIPSNTDDALTQSKALMQPVAKNTKAKIVKTAHKIKHSRSKAGNGESVRINSESLNNSTSSDNDEDHQTKSKSKTKLYKNWSCDENSDNDSTDLRTEYNSGSKDQTQLNVNKKKTNTVIKANTNEIATEFKREIVNSDGSKDIWYPNGNLKKISADGMTIRMLYFNKDIKETNVNEGTVKYYYAETNTWHTTYLDGLEILEFPNGQTEHRYKNGVVEVHFPNNSIKITNTADEHKQEEWRFADGTNLIKLRNGDKILMLPNGQKEIHTKSNKRREYPDGTIKIVYPDGSQETRYSNGRVRLKDKDGKLVMDTENST